MEKFVVEKKGYISIPPSIHSAARTFWPLDETPCNFWKNCHMLKFNLNTTICDFEIMGSVFFTCGHFEIAHGARPIPILYPCFTLDKVKRKITLINCIEAANRQNSNVYMVNSTFSILYLFKAHVKIILSYILDGFHAIS